jgi:hypothetical protein
MRPTRERVIVEIENLDQALKVEETIKTGYCDAVAENLLTWIAAEEDIAESYRKLSEKYNDKKEIQETLLSLSEESKGTIEMVKSLLDSIEELGAMRDRRLERIRSLIAKSPK